MQRVSTYQNRIKALGIPGGGIIDSQLAQNVHGIKTSEKLRPDSGASNGGKVENLTENLGAEFDDLVMKDNLMFHGIK
jgi:hypothetical protein